MLPHVLSHNADSLLCSFLGFVAADSRMAREPCEGDMALSLGNRNKSVKNLVFVEFGDLLACVLLSLLARLVNRQVEVFRGFGRRSP